MNFNVPIVKFILFLLIVLNGYLIAQTQTTFSIRLNHNTGQDAYIADNYFKYSVA